ncbi:MAG TPA: NAD-dependent epimerase/dehydratase family protein [Gemmatimonadaceae bacterium]|jgi:nucleoside-diphosphate-sugar epimerase
MKNQRVAVTGATGQVGATLVKRLHEQGWHVVAATRNALGAALVHANVPDCDIRVGGLSRADGQHLLDDCEIVLNCAIASSGGNPRAAYSRNRALIDGLLEAKSLRWLVHFSTVAVFGELIREHSDERDAFENPKPGSEYGRSKLYVERYAARQARARGVKATMLRLGHVYGAGIGRSREIIELSRDPSFRLPYDGRFPSNAIQVDTLAESILTLLGGDAARETYSFAERASTWRNIFDWHTEALGLAPVRGLSQDESDRMRDVWARASVSRELGAWVRGLPVKRLVRAPSMFDLALRILVRTPASITTRVTNINRRVGARGAVGSALGGSRAALPPLYLSAGMPGPFLDLAAAPASGPGSEAERRRELQEWYHLWSTPRIAASPRLERAAAGARS